MSKSLSVGNTPRIKIESVGGDVSVVGWDGADLLIKGDDDEIRFEQTGVDAEGRILGHLKATGIRPAFADQFEVAGVSLSPTFFLNSARW